MRSLRALVILLLLFGATEFIAHFYPVGAQSGLPWTDTCKSEENTCLSDVNASLNNCIAKCTGNITVCQTACKAEYKPETTACTTSYNSCLNSRENTCVTYCAVTVCDESPEYSKYVDTPACQCACSYYGPGGPGGSNNPCGGTAPGCSNNATAVCQYDSSSGQFGYACPQCSGSAPSCSTNANGLATCKNDSSGFGQWICPGLGCTTAAPSCSSGVATCTSGTWNCPSSSGGGSGGGTSGCVPGDTSCGFCGPSPGNICPNGSAPQCVQGTSGSYSYVCFSPILLDVDGSGFHMTDAQDGVRFTLDKAGATLQIGWTAQGSTNAWLALDRNGNGKIDDATELFGNMTPQPPSPDRNGFLALAVYDNPQNGGNDDGFIDEHDAIYDKLLLWQDTNHDGISQPQELHHLSELGIARIDLHYDEVDRIDANGNAFHLRGRVWDSQGHRGGRFAWDVYPATLR
jgi:hypothetical protein